MDRMQETALQNAHGSAQVPNAMKSVNQNVNRLSVKPDAMVWKPLAALWTVTNQNVQSFARRLSVQQGVQNAKRLAQSRSVS